jgi:uncharacterized protein
VRKFFTKGREPRDARAATRICFATDIHGSELCFRKLLNAAKLYRVDSIVVGGDITGKSIVPIERGPGGYRATYRDHQHEGMTQSELGGLMQAIRDNGEYPFVGERDEVLALAEQPFRDQAFATAVQESLSRWAELAEQRLKDTQIRCFITPGNDDIAEADDVLQRAAAIEFVEGRSVALSDEHEMITTGYSNPTPWATPRELSEEGLRARLESMFAEVKRPETLVAVLHAPPYGTQLDQAPAIDGDLKLKRAGGSPAVAPVGSTAVRDFIMDRQPLLALHGHVHESRGIERLGRTLCVNPGSEYSAGSLLCAVVTLRGHNPPSAQLITG